MNRRELLATAGAMAVIGATGCLGDDDATETPDGTTTTGSPDGTPATGSPDGTPTTGTPTISPGGQMALSVATGESYLIPAGETETYESVDVDGTLGVQGTLTLA